ncbi:SGNH/GDSL hydrolase family protein [Wenjunlia vitaminophila]|uniref:SGNH/GDSL hydrolase family protein n=1 Tax=Wenjunlia vitaminophila TaxID=76728 RepID=UPI0003721684|nr:SGNH/GDSL hydrolase family protein [Wenjunlia vitaminophila]
MTTPADGATQPDSESADPHVLPPHQVDHLLDGAPWRRLAIIGDSLAEGLGDPSPGYADASWADRLASALRRVRPDLAYLNLGRRHLRAAQVRDQQLHEALEFRPDLVSVVCGGNDMMMPDYDPVVVEAELDALVAPFREMGADVFLFTIQDITAVFPEQLGRGSLRQRIEALNERVRMVAQRRGALVVDMASHPTRADRESFSADMIHASRRGHAVLASATVSCLAGHLAARAVTPQDA